MRCLHFDFGANLRAVVAGHRARQGASSLPEDEGTRNARPADPPEHVETSGNFTPEEIAFLQDVLETGALLEDEHFCLAERILRAFIKGRGAEQGTCVVLNGLPRHVGQARALDRVLDVQALVVLECSESTVHRRIEGNVGGDRDHRTDDDPPAVRRKIELFEQRTRPLVDHYRRRGTPIQSVTVAPETTAEEMRRAIEATLPGLSPWPRQPGPSEARA